MSRGIGEARVASELPDVVVAVAGLVTQAGDMWFVLVAVTALFLVQRLGVPLSDDPRQDCLFLLAIAVGSYSLTVVLKHAFLLPRPPGAATATPPVWLPGLAGPAYESMVTGDGYGFPSGHALKTTAVYGGAAATLSVWNANRRVAAAGAAIVAVALSRVLLGVHYLADVAAGVVVGGAFLILVIRATDRHPGRAFGLASALGAIAYGTSFTGTSALATGVAIFGLVVWAYTEQTRNVTPSGRPTPTLESDDDR